MQERSAALQAQQQANDAELQQLLAGIWGRRTDRYSEERTSQTRAGKVEMYHIGG